MYHHGNLSSIRVGWLMYAVSSGPSNRAAVVVKWFCSLVYQLNLSPALGVSLVKSSPGDMYICERFLHVYIKWILRVRKNSSRLNAFSFISSVCIFICLFLVFDERIRNFFLLWWFFLTGENTADIRIVLTWFKNFLDENLSHT